MLKSKVSISFVSALITGVLLGISLGLAKAENITTISVVGRGESCPCGSHGSAFYATYNGKKIAIFLNYNPTPANPVHHPIVVMKNNKPLESLDLFCSRYDEKCPIDGSKIKVSGRWSDETSFDGYKAFNAYKIWLGSEIELPLSSAKSASFDCSKAKTAAEIAICNSADLCQMDKELALSYRSLLKDYEHDPGIVKKLRGTQKSWLVERNRCSSDASCIRVRYQERIVWLREFEAYN